MRVESQAEVGMLKLVLVCIPYKLQKVMVILLELYSV